MSQVALVGILGLVAIAACWALAVLLYRVGSTGSVSRNLALLLLIEGITLLSAEFPELTLSLIGLDIDFWDSFWGQHPALIFTASFVHYGGDAAMIALYPPFLAATLKTKLTRPFARKRIRLVVTGTSVALFLGAMASYAIWDSELGAMILYIAVMALFVFGLVASLQAWHAAKPGIERERARIFAIAFGIRDIGWGISYAVSSWIVWTGSSWWVSNLLLSTKIPYALGSLLAVPLIAYGILRTQLFDIDLKIRWSIKQTVLGVAVAIIMFLVSEVAERLLTGEVGNFQSFLIAAVVVIFLTPLQRFADRFASAAMPNTKDTPEYAMRRKKEVYQSAFSEAQYEGGVSDKERALLVVLRDSLGISVSDADTIEADLQNNFASS
ncbi:MAG: hypothetical protein ACI9H8_002204 [Lysobacterales bacterium]|jgi:hypothetical protein